MRLPKPSYDQIGTAVAGTIAFEADLLLKDPEMDPHEVERHCDNHFVTLLAATVAGNERLDAVRERVMTAVMARPEHRAHLRDFFDDTDTEEIAAVRTAVEKASKGEGGTA